MIKSIKIKGLRCFDRLALDFSPDFNFIWGENGSGKSTILEALHLLSTGRSFRSRNVEALIKHESSEFALFAELVSTEIPQVNLAFRRTLAGGRQIRLNGEAVKSFAEISHLLPLQLLTPEAYLLLTDGPKMRRQFIDWGGFHVEPDFINVWQRFQRTLKQRNALLHQGVSSYEELAVWDVEYIALAQQLAAYRKQYIEAISSVFFRVYPEFLSGLNGISLTYQSGWDMAQDDLSTQLRQSFFKDRKLGYSTLGPQRADLCIEYQGCPVQDFLSRGQQKLLVYALKLAQGLHLHEQLAKPCLYLFDDMAAELDANSRQKVLAMLAKIGSQVMITGLNADDYCNFISNSAVNTKEFHVKQLLQNAEI